jgi:hypothetical protein
MKIYSIDDKDKVIPFDDLPPSSVGAPIPVILADEHTTVVAYYTQEDEIDNENTTEPIAIITFNSCRSTMFGPPNDEAFRGHPLYSRGLKPYSSFIIKNSSWLRKLIEMNSVHPYHNANHFNDYKHFILSFHDSTFECIAESYKTEIVTDSFSNVIDKMKSKLTI